MFTRPIVRFLQVVVVLGLFGRQGSVAAQKPEGPDPSPGSIAPSDPAAFQFVVSGIRQQGRKLVSGVCRFHGTHSRKYKNDTDKDFEGPVEGFLAIDGGKVRFDLSGPGAVIDRTSIQRNAASPGRVTARTVAGTFTHRFADDGTRLTLWHSDNPLLSIAQSKDVPDRQATEYVDIRGITLFDRLSFNRGLTLEKVLDNLESYQKFEGKVTPLDESIWLLTWVDRDKHVTTKWSLAVDVMAGFSPVNYKCESRPVEPKDAPWRVEWENKTTWKQINGAWVSSHHEFIIGGPTTGLVDTRTFDFDWENVNQPVDDALFTYRTFQIPEDAGILDVSSGRAVWLKPLPGDHGEVARESFTPRSSWRPLLITGLLVLVLVTLVLARVPNRLRSRHA